MNNNDFDNNSDQFVLSYELIQLMEWLTEKGDESLKSIIKKALTGGLETKMKKNKNSQFMASHAQGSIINFLSLLEIILAESINEYSVDRIMEKNLIPAIDQVDTKACGSSTLKSSIEIATSKSDRNPRQNPQELFLKELLKQWNPAKKKQVIN